ncbi:hypothetical protein B0H19DRAFT_1073783 [Mycena capillaripes]|nr:hypothetical protein B0H19DRAFT_1073783 [Mycena capillaripes]
MSWTTQLTISISSCKWKMGRVAPDFLGRLFDAFTQVDSFSPGASLGLHIFNAANLGRYGTGQTQPESLRVGFGLFTGTTTSRAFFPEPCRRGKEEAKNPTQHMKTSVIMTPAGRSWSAFLRTPTLQQMSVPKARIEKMPFGAFFDPCDRSRHISMDSAWIELENS